MNVKYNGSSWANWCNDLTPDIINDGTPIYNCNDTILGGTSAFSGLYTNSSGCCTGNGWSFIQRTLHFENANAFLIDSLAFRFCLITDGVNRNHEGVQIDYFGIYLEDACNVGIKSALLKETTVQIVPNPIISESKILINTPVDYFEIYNLFGILVKSAASRTE